MIKQVKTNRQLLKQGHTHQDIMELTRGLLLAKYRKDYYSIGIVMGSPAIHFRAVDYSGREHFFYFAVDDITGIPSSNITYKYSVAEGITEERDFFRADDTTDYIARVLRHMS